jgi:RND family efflux transporter MFP subunit
LGACRGEEVSRQIEPPVVRVFQVGLADSSNGLLLSGELEADMSVAVSFKGLGTVESVVAREGQVVRKGQLLATLERGALEDQHAAAKAKASQAEDAWKRMEPMHRNGTLPEIKWVELETGLEQARSMEAIARRNLDDARLLSPIDGVVARRNVEAGEATPVGAAAFTIVRTGTMLSAVSVSERDVASVKVGDPATVDVPAVGRIVSGRVRDIGVQADPFTRTYKVKVAIANPSGALRIGMVTRTNLRVPGRAGVPVVPVSAVLVDENERRYAWIVTDSVVHRRFLRLGGFAGEGLEVDSGLVAGEVVVASGTPMLSDGVRIRVEK